MRSLEYYQKELARVKEILRANPRGMTITDISREINVNRNSVAKYLDILLISGQVDMMRIGPAKVFFLSHRVPISAMLNFSSDYIMVFNSRLEVVQVNDNLLEFINAEREDMIGKNMSDAPPWICNNQDIQRGLSNGLNGADSLIEFVHSIDGDVNYFSIKFVPTTFQDGSLGVTLIMEDITERRKIEETLKSREHELQERLKELTCLYGISQLCDEAKDVEDILRKALLLIPQACQYTKLTCARIKYGEITFETPNFKETDWRQSADLNVFDGIEGSVEVFYLEMPDSRKRAFLEDERNLIEAIAQQLSKMIERLRYREKLEALHDQMDIKAPI